MNTIEYMSGNYETMKTILKETMTEFGHGWKEEGIEKWFEEWNRNKQPLMEMLSKMDGYNGNGQVVIDHPMERENSADEVRKIVDSFLTDISAKCKVIQKKNADGKTMKQIVRENSKDQPDIIKTNKLVGMKFRVPDFMKDFDNDGNYIPSVEAYHNLCNAMNIMRYQYSPKLSKETADKINEIYPKIRATEGQKTSRLFNKIFTNIGLAEQEAGSVYQRKFSDYANAVSGLKRQMVFIISVNANDFLRMSFGNSWSSCHTIDRSNRRRMPSGYSGMHCGGTASYMMDGATIITYVLPKEEYLHGATVIGGESYTYKEHPELCDKTYRNLYFWNGHGVLIQSRVYPQGNDGATDLYKEFRIIVEDAIAKAYGVDSKWKAEGLGNTRNYITSYGVHYPDYSYDHMNPKRVTLKDVYDGNDCFTIGHDGICPVCGRNYNRNNGFEHYDCLRRA